MIANIHIEDSYRVSKNSFKAVLATYNNESANIVKSNRSTYSLCMEWAVHNCLYSLGLWKERTKDVDLNYPNKWSWLYCVLGTLVYPFIK